MANGDTNRRVSLTLEAKNLSAKPFQEVSAQLDALSNKLVDQASKAGSSDVTLRELTTTLGKLKDVQSALAAQTALVERYKQLSTELQNADAKAKAAASALNALKSAQDGSEKQTRAQARALNAAQTAADKTNASYAKLLTKVETTGEALSTVGAELSNLEGFQAELAASTQRVTQAYAQGQVAVENYDQSIREHRKAVADAKAADEAAAEAAKRLAQEEKNAAAFEAQADQAFEQAADAKHRAEQRAIADAEAAYDAQARRELEEHRLEIAATQRAAGIARAMREEQLAAQAAVINKKAELQAQDQLNVAIARDAELRKADKQATDALVISMQKALGLSERQAKTANSQGRVTPEGGVGGGEAGGGASGGSGLGLTQFQIENLGYRVKDVIDQLGSGSSVVRVIAQQGAATLSIFERQIGSLLSLLPALGAGAAVLGVFGAALYRVAESAASLREFNTQLRVSVDGANYQTEALLADQRAMQALGASFKESGDALREFVSAGIRSDQLLKFGKAANDVSRVFGVQLPDAAKEVTEAFTRNYAAVEALDNKYNFLTLTQRENIRAQFESGHASEAQATSFNLFSEAMSKASSIAKGPLAEAFISARNAFNSFLDLIGKDSLLHSLVTDFKDAADGAKTFADRLNGIRGAGDVPTKAAEDALKAKLADLQAQKDSLKQSGQKENPTLPFEPRDLQVVLAQMRDVQAQLDAITKARNAAGDAAEIQSKKDVAASQAALRAQTQLQAKVTHDAIQDAELQHAAEVRNDIAAKVALARRQAIENADPNVNDAGKRRLADIAENTVREQAALVERRREEGIEREVESLTKQGDASLKDSLAARLDAVNKTYDAIGHKIEDLQKYGKNDVFGVPISEVKAQVAAQEELVKQQVTQKFYEDELKALVGERDAAYKQLNEDIKAGTISAANGYQQSIALNAKLSPQIKKLATDALAFGEALQKAKPGPQIDAFVDSTRRQLSSETGTAGSSGTQGQGEKALDSEIERGNQIVAARNELQKAYAELVLKGQLTTEQAEAKLKQNYKETDSALQSAIDDAVALAKALSATGKDTAALDLYLAKLKLLQTEQKYVSKSSEETNKAIAQSFGSSATKALEGITDQFGKLVAGQENLKQALQGAGKALEGFVADFLKGIAEILLKKEEEIVVQSILDALGGGGGGDGGAVTTQVIGSSTLHDGGIVGPGGSPVSRKLPAAWFANAPRYHSGGVVGLQPNEQAAVLQHGEEVLTRNDPRNAMNRTGSGSQAPVNLRHVLVMDPQIIPQAMLGAPGERVTMSHIKQNIATLRQWINTSSRK